MKIDHRDLQELYQAYIKQKIPLTRDRCPDIEELVACFDSRKSNKRKAKTLDHVVNCADCFQEFDFICQTLSQEKKLEDEIEAVVQPRDRLTSTRSRSAFSKLSFGYASLFFGALVLMLSFMILLKSDFLKRRANDDRGRQPGQIILLQPLQKTKISVPLVFGWRESEGSDSYLLELYDETLRLVWRSSRLSETKLLLPHDIAARLTVWRDYFWMVTSFKDQEKRHESSLQRFRLSD
jgi:hypothetical protein